MELPLNKQFALVQLKAEVDRCQDIEALKEATKDLLNYSYTKDYLIEKMLMETLPKTLPHETI